MVSRLVWKTSPFESARRFNISGFRNRRIKSRLGTVNDNNIQYVPSFEASILNFQEQITKKVQDVLAKTPLKIEPRRELPRIGQLKKISTAPLIDLEPTEKTVTQEPTPLPKPQTIPKPDIPIHIRKVSMPQEEPKLNILGFEVIEKESPSRSPQHIDPNWDMKTTNSLELLTPSPLGFTPFDSRSIDELLTPDEFAQDLPPGLGTINYDIDLSDFSGDNSVAEDTPKSPKAKDPFSPDGIKKFDPFAPQTSADFKALETFDEFTLDSKIASNDPFEVVHRTSDPFSPDMAVNMPADPFAPQQKESSILDVTESPTAACLLPSPLLPQSGKP